MSVEGAQGDAAAPAGRTIAKQALVDGHEAIPGVSNQVDDGADSADRREECVVLQVDHRRRLCRQHGADMVHDVHLPKPVLSQPPVFHIWREQNRHMMVYPSHSPTHMERKTVHTRQVHVVNSGGYGVHNGACACQSLPLLMQLTQVPAHHLAKKSTGGCAADVQQPHNPQSGTPFTQRGNSWTPVAQIE